MIIIIQLMIYKLDIEKHVKTRAQSLQDNLHQIDFKASLLNSQKLHGTLPPVSLLNAHYISMSCTANQ